MKCSLDISNFLEEISSLSLSILLHDFFALITEEGFLISPCYSWALCIEMGVSFLFPLPLTSLLFSSICKKSNPGLHIAGGFFTSWATREAQENSMEWSIFNGVNIYPFSSISSRPRNLTSVSDIAGLFFTRWAIREAPSNALVEKLFQCFWVY